MRLALLLALVALPALCAELSPELQIALTSLRGGERARLEKALGPAGGLPFYRGDLVVDPDGRRVTGRVAVTLTAPQLVEELLFRLTPNAAHPGAVLIAEAKVNGAPARTAQPDPSLVRVVVDPPVLAGEAVTVELTLRARVPQLPPPNPLAGLAEARGGDYGAFSASSELVSLAGLLPLLAPEVHGRLVEGPAGIGDLGTGAPAHFLVSVAAPAAWQVFSGGALVGEVPQGDGTTRTAYALAAAREFPLVLLRHPEVAVKQAGDVRVEAVTFKVDAKRGKAVAESAARLLELLEARVGPYPYKTLRVVQARFSGGAGGMEFPGLVTVSATLYGGEASPLEALGLGGPHLQAMAAFLGPALGELLKHTLEFTLAHELAHQYTAMLVGNDPVGEPLADEALTQHLALLLLEWRHGKATANQMRDGQLKAAYQLHRMLGGADGKADRPAHEFDSNREYAALVYGKAPLAFDAMREVVGAEAWLQALRRYVETNRYRWVTSGTFLEQLCAAHPAHAKKLKGLARRWWSEAHGDEDLGGADLEQLIGHRGAGLQALDPAALERALKLMQELMRQ